MRRRWPRWAVWLLWALSPLLVVLAVLAIFFVVIPFVLPFLALDMEIDRRCRARAVERTSCTACGAWLGAWALDLADEHWRASMATVRRDGMRVRLARVARRIDAVCSLCGARYGWDGKHRRFEAVDDHRTRPEPGAASGLMAPVGAAAGLAEGGGERRAGLVLDHFHGD